MDSDLGVKSSTLFLSNLESSLEDIFRGSRLWLSRNNVRYPDRILGRLSSWQWKFISPDDESSLVSSITAFVQRTPTCKLFTTYCNYGGQAAVSTAATQSPPPLFILRYLKRWSEGGDQPHEMVLSTAPLWFEVPPSSAPAPAPMTDPDPSSGNSMKENATIATDAAEKITPLLIWSVPNDTKGSNLEARYSLLIGCPNADGLDRFFEKLSICSIVKGYREFTAKGKYDGEGWKSAVNVVNYQPFEDLIGCEAKRDLIVADIDNYFANIASFRKLGANHGINYVFYGPPGTGKTSFIKALAGHYHANLCWVTDSGSWASLSNLGKQMNPKLSGLTLVVADDFTLDSSSSRDTKDLIQQIYDVGSENVIRFFIVNQLATIKDRTFFSRVRRFIHFEPPTADQITQFVQLVFPQTSPANVAQLAHVIAEKDRQRVEATLAKISRAHAATRAECLAGLETAKSLLQKVKLATALGESPLEAYASQERQIADLGKKLEELDRKHEAEKNKIRSTLFIGYRELCFFLSDYVGHADPVKSALDNLDQWIQDRSQHMDPSKKNLNHEDGADDDEGRGGGGGGNKSNCRMM
jgi:DNA polymerase III delta prime subunit